MHNLYSSIASYITIFINILLQFPGADLGGASAPFKNFFVVMLTVLVTA